MLTFLITTSTKLASISLFENKNMLASININVRRTHSTTIMDQVDKLFEWTGKNINEVTNVIISKGPGSFTGVRIAMSLIKGLFCLSPNVNIFSVSELDAIQYNAKNYAEIVVAGIDSRKGKIYYSIYENGNIIQQDEIGNIIDIVNRTIEINKPTVFAGDIYLPYKNIIEQNKKLVDIPTYKLGIDSRVYFDMFENNLLQKEDIASIVPYYLEKSQAEKDYKGD